MKRTVLSTAIVACMTLALSGCGNDTPTGSGHEAAPAPANNAAAGGGPPIPAPGGSDSAQPEAKK